MDKEVLVRVKNCQSDGKETDEMEITTTGTYYQKNGSHYVVYEEMMEGFDIITKTFLKITGDMQRVKIRKSGVINSEMVFEKGFPYNFIYKTPFGELAMDVNVKELTCSVTEDRVQIACDYDMTINYDFTFQNQMTFEAIVR